MSRSTPRSPRLTGYDESEAVGRNCRFLQGPSTDRAEVRCIAEAIEERRTASFEILNYRRDGTPFWNALHVSPVYDGEGELIRFFGSQWDVTEKVEALQALQGHRRLTDQRLQAAIDEVRRLKVGLDEAREAVVITEHAPIDEPGPRIVYVSKGFERITGYSSEEAIGANPRILQGPRTNRSSLDTVRRHLEEDRSLRSRTVNYRKDGTAVPSRVVDHAHPRRGRSAHPLAVGPARRQRRGGGRGPPAAAGERAEPPGAQPLLARARHGPGARGRGADGAGSTRPGSWRACARSWTRTASCSTARRRTARPARVRGWANSPPRCSGRLGDEDRVHLSGEEVRLGSRQSLNAALLLHELGTNALKHGALSAPDGRVDVRWRLDGGEVQLDWTESGGPAVAPPVDGLSRRGFGSQLIAMMVETSMRDDAGLEHRPDGLRCRIGLPDR